MIANDRYCETSNLDNNSSIGTRQYYNIGEVISDEDQLYEYNICHSDGIYNTGSTFKLNDYSGNIILISMNATW